MKTNTWKENRALSFVLVAAVYLIAGAAGVWLYRVLPLPWQWALLAADGAATVITFVFSVIFKNASVYDPYWSVQPPVILTAYAVTRAGRATWPPLRAVLDRLTPDEATLPRSA